MMIDNETISFDNWVMRIQRPGSLGPFRVILMLHGWTGDENSMWVFSSRLPNSALLVAPRGLFPARGTAGYSWHPEISAPWPWLNDFQFAVEKLFEVLSTHNFPQGDFNRLHIIGFSQGTALAYTMAILHPGRIASLVGLSGFLPEGASAHLMNGRLSGLPVFIAHGTQDDRVPIDRARLSVSLLHSAGADVTYCEDDVGHKLSAKCFRGLEAFYQRLMI
jgi:phospholipase/carboxylesterase